MLKVTGKARALSSPRARRPAGTLGTCPTESAGRRAHFYSAHGGCHMNTTTASTGLQSLSISQRIIAGSLALLLGLTLLVGTGFAGDFRLHNGAHDTRHAMGFPCH